VGEILILRDQKLYFARRSGKWHFLTHEPVLSQMGGPDNRAVRQAVHESCLDASFARTGACVGLVTTGNLSKWKSIVTSEADHISKQASLKAKALHLMVGDKPFQELDRRLRQEILAIDGATLLDAKGRVLAVGAILKIGGGSAGGGRLAAAKELSRFGAGIKVSQDGGILGFRNSKQTFVVMAT
jgi:hypothetical protein